MTSGASNTTGQRGMFGSWFHKEESSQAPEQKVSRLDVLVEGSASSVPKVDSSLNNVCPLSAESELESSDLENWVEIERPFGRKERFLLRAQTVLNTSLMNASIDTEKEKIGTFGFRQGLLKRINKNLVNLNTDPNKGSHPEKTEQDSEQKAAEAVVVVASYPKSSKKLTQQPTDLLSIFLKAGGGSDDTIHSLKQRQEELELKLANKGEVLIAECKEQGLGVSQYLALKRDLVRELDDINTQLKHAQQK